jgi:MFS family permease
MRILASRSEIKPAAEATEIAKTNLAASSPIQLGLKENWQQFALLVLINAFVGAMVGMERTILPLIANADFGLASKTATLSFLVSFGIVKALSNLFAGRFSERIGRKRILVVGWLAGLGVPILLILAPNWGWVVIANVLLGVNQGLCWSTTVIMKIDLVGPKRRGLAMGLNEAAGYLALSFSALLTGYLAAAYGLRPAPFLPGLVFAGCGLLLSAFFTRETLPFAHLEAAHVDRSIQQEQSITAPSFSQVFGWTSWQNRSLFSASQAGLINNMNDGLVWGLIPIFLGQHNLPLGQIAVITALYPGVWGIGQLATGAISDHLGRKWMIAIGMMIQAVGIGWFAFGDGFAAWAAAAVLLGVGTALVYPTLLAAISDVAHPTWRASAVGVYRLWRDGGYAVGALLAGFLADIAGISLAIVAIAGLTFLSGMLVAIVMRETLPRKRSIGSPKIYV